MQRFYQEDILLMNIQYVTAKIWESANQIRSKKEASEYKDYILGFIFYKYLSDEELLFANKASFSAKDIKALNEKNAETINYIKVMLDTYIAYEHLFSTYVTTGKISIFAICAMHFQHLADLFTQYTKSFFRVI